MLNARMAIYAGSICGLMKCAKVKEGESYFLVQISGPKQKLNRIDGTGLN
jgi:hypothetical protein